MIITNWNDWTKILCVSMNLYCPCGIWSVIICNLFLTHRNKQTTGTLDSPAAAYNEFSIPYSSRIQKKQDLSQVTCFLKIIVTFSKKKYILCYMFQNFKNRCYATLYSVLHVSEFLVTFENRCHIFKKQIWNSVLHVPEFQKSLLRNSIFCVTCFRVLSYIWKSLSHFQKTNLKFCVTYSRISKIVATQLYILCYMFQNS